MAVSQNPPFLPFDMKHPLRGSETVALPQVKLELIAACRYHVCQVFGDVSDRHRPSVVA